jgi:hypothetical protein
MIPVDELMKATEKQLICLQTANEHRFVLYGGAMG